MDVRNILITGLAIPLIVMVVQRTRRFSKGLTAYVVDAFFWLFGRHLFKRLSKSFSFRQYARTLLADPASRYLLVPGKAGISVETDEVFVPVELQGANQVRLPHRFARHGADLGLPFAGDDNRYRIVGDPGSGKSSLLKRALRDACRRALEARESIPLPILVELRAVAVPREVEDEMQLADWMLDQLRQRVCSVEGFEMGKLFDSLLVTDGLVVMLDGLDEVPAHDLTRMLRALNALSRRLANRSPNSRIVVTMRTQFHKDVRQHLEEEFPVAGYVQPFTPGDIYRFLNQWPFEGDRASQVSRIYSDLTDRPTLREMCSNPLVLAMYVAQAQAAAGTTIAPDTRTEFYSQVVEELLVARRSRQLDAPQIRALREARERVLGALALENLTDASQPANSLSWRRAVELVQGVYNDETPSEADARLRDIARNTGLFVEEREGETLRFIHLTFCEFLAAVECVQGRRHGWRELLEKHRELLGSEDKLGASRLAEVIPFTVALLPRVQRPNALDAVWNLDDRAVQARCFLETQAYDHPTWLVFVEREAADITSVPEQAWDHYWLGRLHLLSVLLGDASQWAAHLGRDAGSVSLDQVFKALVGSSRRRLLRVFSAYASQDAAAAFRLATSLGVDMITEAPEIAVMNCVDPPFLGLAVQRSRETQSHVADWASVLAEAALTTGVVAPELLAVPAPEQYVRAEQMVPRRFRWSFTPPHVSISRWFPGAQVAASPFLFSVLAIGVNRVRRDETSQAQFPALARLARVKGPARTVATNWLRASAVVVLALGVAVATATYYRLGSGTATASLAFVGILLYGASIAHWLGRGYPRYRAEAFAIAAGLLPPFFLGLQTRSLSRIIMRTFHADVCGLITPRDKHRAGLTWFDPSSVEPQPES